MHRTLKQEMDLLAPSNFSLPQSVQQGLFLLFRGLADSGIHYYDEHDIVALEAEAHVDDFDHAEGARYVGQLGAMAAAHRIIGFVLDGATE